MQQKTGKLDQKNAVLKKKFSPISLKPKNITSFNDVSLTLLITGYEILHGNLERKVHLLHLQQHSNTLSLLFINSILKT